MIAKLSKKERTKILHTQLMTYFRERILDGRLRAGTRLPADGELATQYQISRDTVRQALALLVNEGLIERVQGRGTFVSQPASNDSPVTIASVSPMPKATRSSRPAISPACERIMS